MSIKDRITFEMLVWDYDPGSDSYTNSYSSLLGYMIDGCRNRIYSES
jgi:hypothetical protein